MAFMSLMLVGIFLAIFCSIFLIAIVLFIIGVCVRKKYKKASNVLFIISGIDAGLLVAALMLIFIPMLI